MPRAGRKVVPIQFLDEDDGFFVYGERKAGRISADQLLDPQETPEARCEQRRHRCRVASRESGPSRATPHGAEGYDRDDPEKIAQRTGQHIDNGKSNGNIPVYNIHHCREIAPSEYKSAGVAKAAREKAS